MRYNGCDALLCAVGGTGIMLYLISYQIKRNRGRSSRSTVASKEAVEDAIAEFGAWRRYLMNVWIVDTAMTVGQMNEKLLKCLSPEDDLLIIGIQEPYQGWLPEEAWKWLNKKMEDKRLAAAR